MIVLRSSIPCGKARRLILALTLGAVTGCGVPTWRAALYEPDVPAPAPGSSSWLKVHLHSGDLYVMESWEVPDEAEPLRGTGVHYDVDRAVVRQGDLSVVRDSIALLEANDKETVSRFALGGLSVFTAFSAFVTAACLADPKSCFGSCPTFYESVDAERPLAEGFSSSFARVLEDGDLDHLGVRRAPGPFALVMRNEAQETHAVRHVRLLAVPASPGEDVLLTRDGRFRRSTGRAEAVTCRSEDGSCLHDILRRDDDELSSTTDPEDLARREEVIVDFGSVRGPVGLVLTARHSFVSTYVFYQALAYGGQDVGGVLADLERGDPEVKDRVLGVSRALGGIDVQVSVGGRAFVSVGAFEEAGPIAADQQLFELADPRGEVVRVKLEMARGSWRIDEVALARLGPVLQPVSLHPDSVETLGRGADDALERLADPERYLVTTQGDAHRIWFDLPPGSEYELFLDTRGYYYEWMRGAWLAEQDPVAAATVLLDPRRALREMAPGFKGVEGEMEQLFWSSRFRRQ